MSIREPRTGARRRSRSSGHVRRRNAPLVEPAAPIAEVAPHEPRPRDLRADITALSGLNVLAGIWLIIAPWVLNYSARDPKWNDVVFGIIVGLLALTRATGAYRDEGLSWINALIGVWLFIAAFAIDHSGAAAWNDIVLGVVVFVLAIGSADATANLLARRGTRARQQL